MNAKTLNSEEFKDWDAYVLNHPEGTIFHTTQWLWHINESVNVTAVVEEDKIVGGMAYVITTKNRATGLHIPPYTQYFGPLLGTPQNLSQKNISIEGPILEFLLKNLPRTKHIDFKLPPGHQNILPYYWEKYSTEVTVTHRIENITDVTAGMHKSKKRYINKLLELQKDNTLQFDQNVTIDEIIQMQEITGERSSFNINKNALTRIVTDNKNIFAAGIRHVTEGLLACAMLAVDNKCMYFLINASKRHSDATLNKANILSVYNLLSLAKERKLAFDFEGSMLKGVEEFYRHMGGIQTPVYRVQKSPSLYYSLLRAGKQILNDRK